MERVIAFAGNPNVGKSTLFNAVTGMKQHTGNWTGKTVETASAVIQTGQDIYCLVDLPGCYSLFAHSPEEETARNFICFQNPDAVIAVCDAECLERNLNLVLQICEITQKIVLCVNLMDEAQKKKIRVDFQYLEERLHIPVVGTSAAKKEGLEGIFKGIAQVEGRPAGEHVVIRYPKPVERAVDALESSLKKYIDTCMPSRWIAVRLLEGNEGFLNLLNCYLGFSLSEHPAVCSALKQERERLVECGYDQEHLLDVIAETFVKESAKLAGDAVYFGDYEYSLKDRRLDCLFTGKKTGFFFMLLMLLGIFWITLSGANLLSEWLSVFLFNIEDKLLSLSENLHLPSVIYEPAIYGIYRVTAWVVSVMLPPMTIFFPLFSILEDFGYLPRVAFNLDRCFHKCSACGKQALTMCMGLGCNAVGITGCRIIDSPRERMIAMLTNSLVPCNGRFPAIIAMLSIFFAGTAQGLKGSFFSAVLLVFIIVISVFATFVLSYILSKTILKGMSSSFTLELPPYRKPQFKKIIITSVTDRTLFVLYRAIAVAAPVGLIIWIMANLTVGDKMLISHLADFLDPFARFLGLDGVILIAFILGFPANEIVLPLICMIYLAQGNLQQITELESMGQILCQNGWTWITAGSMILFSLMHWPCGTACLTIRKETKSNKWMAAAIIIPTVMGCLCCILFSWGARIISMLL